MRAAYKYRTWIATSVGLLVAAVDKGQAQPVPKIASHWLPLWFPGFCRGFHWQPKLKSRLFVGALCRSSISAGTKQLISRAKIGVMRFGSFAPGETLAAPKLSACILAYPSGSY